MSSTNLETPIPRNSSSSCPKLPHLASLEPSASSSSSVTTVASQPSSISTENAHCSISQQSGGNGAGLAPIMEIREMNSYCNSCVTVGADKYWNPHHPHANVPRHTAVYPQMFYTPPPPPHPTPAPPSSTYTASSSSTVVAPAPPSNDWSCPPSTADSYSHYIYSQYPPPPPPSSHHDFNNFLGISTSCYESEMMMMGSSAQVQSNCDSAVPASTIMNSFMYAAPLPPPPLSTSFDLAINSVSVSSTHPPQQKTTAKVTTTKAANFSQPPPPSSSASSSTTIGESTDESDDEDDDEESSHIISIEDDDNENIMDDEIASSSATDASAVTSRCVLCKKPASSLPLLAPNAPSPQLSRILDNIDDDELDISVCSGDIEIGGIEDEMIQQATEQEQQKVSLQKLSQLVGISIKELLSDDKSYQVDSRSRECEEEDAVLCCKCQKLVGMADSLEKQLSSVVSTLRQMISLEDTFCKALKFVSTPMHAVAVQTEDYDVDRKINYVQIRRCITNSDTRALDGPQEQAASHIQLASGTVGDGDLTPCQYLCHECGRRFNCKRNLGKHLKRHHFYRSSLEEKGSKLATTCPRESCRKSFPDKTALQVHLRKHTGEKPYFCVHCLKLFTTKSNLTAHVKSNTCQERGVDVPEDDRLTIIPSSPTSQGNTDDLPNSTGFHCENCGLTFRTECRFLKHVNNKAACNKSKVQRCGLCSKLFAKRSELLAHQVVHTKTKSFLCDICGMSFSTRGNQRVHQRTHFNHKRFKCQQCEKGFTRNQTLQSHIVNVHK